MRALIFDDVYKMSKILGKIDVKLDPTAESVAQLGIGAILEVGGSLHLAQKEVDSFLGSMVGITGEEFNQLPFTKVMEYVEAFKKLDGVDAFFKSARKLAEQNQ